MEREPVAKYLVRETPWLYKIIEIVPDYRDNLYIKTIGVGGKGEMIEAYRRIYGEEPYQPEPMTRDTGTSARIFGTAVGRQSRPYADLDD